MSDRKKKNPWDFKPEMVEGFGKATDLWASANSVWDKKEVQKYMEKVEKEKEGSKS